MKTLFGIEYDIALQELGKIKTLSDLYSWKTKYLGHKSNITTTLQSLKTYPPEQRRIIASEANAIKKQLLKLYQKSNQNLTLFDPEHQKPLVDIPFDETIPSFKRPTGYYHYSYLVIKEIKTILSDLGYQFINSPEITTVDENFNALNIPFDHPARSQQDTFYIQNKNNSYLLRTHCTNNTIKMLKKLSHLSQIDRQYAYFSIGNVFRADDTDATHSHQFQQMDGFLIGPDITMSHLKWTINYLCQALFGKKTKLRLRNSFFPFTSPSVEVDIACFNCSDRKNDLNQTCPLCKGTKFIEILGAGMINPLVYQHANFKNYQSVQGFAFGFGIERIVMLKYKVPDIRWLYQNNKDFIQYQQLN